MWQKVLAIQPGSLASWLWVWLHIEGIVQKLKKIKCSKTNWFIHAEVWWWNPTLPCIAVWPWASYLALYVSEIVSVTWRSQYYRIVLRIKWDKTCKTFRVNKWNFCTLRPWKRASCRRTGPASFWSSLASLRGRKGDLTGKFWERNSTVWLSRISFSGTWQPMCQQVLTEAFSSIQPAYQTGSAPVKSWSQL